MSNHVVGYSSVVLLGYSFMLIGVHAFIPHPSVTKKVLSLSYTSLTLLTLAQACIVGTYFIPHISGNCICAGLWSASLVFYVVGLYTLKFVYVERIAILNKHPMLASERISRWIKYISCSLVASCIISVTMMVVLTDGECHEDLAVYGCKPTFHAADIYLAVAMITFDACLFAGFCYKWWSLIRVFKLSSDSQMLVDMIQSFGFQFVLTVSAMLSCVIDGVINLWFQDYSTLIVFCLDCAIVASCDFALIKESQAFMWKYLCWPCKIPAFLIRGHGKSNLRPVASNTSNTKTPEPSKTNRKTDASMMEEIAENAGVTPAPPADLPTLPDMVVSNSMASNGIEIVTAEEAVEVQQN
mmetsp:Transcript_51484/g.82074  ORF Transcript_51484/g.82074 Transcript_51484/m.82074 type:complete len:355 (+) Transcript_51484:231-1295(+)